MRSAMCWILAMVLVTVQGFTPPGSTCRKDKSVLQNFLNDNRHRAATSKQLQMVGGMLGNNKDQTKTPSLPRDVKDAVSKCREAVQKALQDRCSRMDIEMPVGAKFGVEPTAKGKKGGKKNLQSSLNDDDSGGGDAMKGAPTRDVLEQSDRELARLFVEMFQPVGGNNIACVFVEDNLADQAKMRWKDDSGAACRVMAMKRSKGGVAGKKKNKKKAKGMGFAAKLAAEVENDDDGTTGSTAPSGPLELPDNIEVAVFVAPGPKELLHIQRICDKVGMGTLVVLLNARLGSISNFGSDAATKLYMEEFEPVFSLCAAPQAQAPGCLLHRSYPDPWVLARKPKVGPPKPILSQESKPTRDECDQAYNSLELGDMEKGIENVLENVAGWFS